MKTITLEEKIIIREIIDSSIKKIEESIDFTIDFDLRYGSNSFNIYIEGLKNINSVVDEKKNKPYTKVDFNGYSFKIIGYDVRNGKHIILAHRIPDGKPVELSPNDLVYSELVSNQGLIEKQFQILNPIKHEKIINEIKYITKTEWKEMQESAKVCLEIADESYRQYMFDVTKYNILLELFTYRYPDYKKNPDEYIKKDLIDIDAQKCYEEKELNGFEFAPKKPLYFYNQDIIEHWKLIISGVVPIGYKINKGIFTYYKTRILQTT